MPMELLEMPFYFKLAGLQWPPARA